MSARGGVIDEKVVTLKFNNDNFKKNVQGTMSALDALKAKLSFKGGAKGLDEVSASAKRVNFSPINAGLQQVQASFSALEVVGVTALANITNQAVNAGKNMVNALTLKPVMGGFQEYETQINAVQTILANTESKGTTLKDVTAALDELNHYADMTIYNFTEMTRNIGTFTAAGVDLDTSVGAIKGIANLAAVSGSNSEQASRAMYQLSQALAAGTVKLIDWNSVVNAGMGGQVFQDALKDTARVHGVAIDEMIEDAGSFRETLKDGWITSDVLTETLAKFTGDMTEEQLKQIGYTDEQIAAILRMGQTATDAATKVKTITQLFQTLGEALQSGWTQSWELIIGDFEAAKGVLTMVSDYFNEIIGSGSDARNYVLEGAINPWGILTKRVEDSGAAIEDFQEVSRSVLKDHSVDLDSLIEQYGSFESTLQSGWLTPELFDEIANEMRNLGSETEITSENVSDLFEYMSRKSGRELIFETVQNSLQILQNILVAVGSAFSNTFGGVGVNDVYSFIKGLNGLVSSIANAEEMFSGFGIALQGVLSVIKTFSDMVTGLVKFVFELAGAFLSAFDINIPATFGQFLTMVGNALISFSKTISNIPNLDAIKSIGKNLLTFSENIGQVVKNLVNQAASSKLFQDFITQLGSSVSYFSDQVESGLSLASTSLGSFVNGLKSYSGSDVLSTFFEMFDTGAKQIEAFVNTVKSIFSGANPFEESVQSIQGITGSSNGEFISLEQILTNIDQALSNVGDSISSQLAAIGNAFSETWPHIAEFVGKIGGFLKDNFGFGQLGVIIAGAVLIKSLKSLTDLFTTLGGIVKPIQDAIENISEGLGAYFKALGQAERLKGLSAVILSCAFAFAVLAASLYAISSLSWEELIKGAAGLGVMVIALVAVVGVMFLFVKLSEKLKGAGVSAVAASTSILSLAGALLAMAIALKILSTCEPSQIASGLFIMAVMLTEISAAAIAVSRLSAPLASGALSIIGLAAALLVMAIAMKVLGSVNFDDPISTLTAMLLIIGLMVALSFAAKGLKFTAALGLIAMAVSVKMVAKSFQSVSEMDFSGVRNNIGALIGIVAMVATLMLATRLAGKNAAAGGASLIMIAIAMRLFVGVVDALGSIEPEKAKNGVIALDALMIALAVAMASTGRAGKGALKAGGYVLAIAIAVGILSGVAILLSKVDPGGLAKGVAAIIALMGGFALIMFAVSGIESDMDGAAETVTKIGIILAVLAISLAALSFIEPSRLLSSTLSLVAVMSALALVFYSMGKMPTGATGKVFGLLGIIIAIGIIINTLAQLNPENALSSAISLGSLLVAMAASMNLLNDVKVSGDVLGKLMIVLLVVGALSSIIGSLSSLDPMTAATNVASISILLETMSIALVIMGKAGDVAPTALAGIVVMTAVVALLAGVLYLIDGLNPGSSLANAVSLSILMVAMSAVLLLITPIGAMAELAILAIGVMATFLTAMLGLLALFGQVSEEGRAVLDNGVKVMGQIGQAIGSFVGGLIGGVIGGIAEGATAKLPAIAMNLMAFMAALLPVTTMAKRIKPEDFNGVKQIVDVIGTLIGDSFLSSVTNLPGFDNMGDLARKLQDFMTEAKKISDLAVEADINEEAINKVLTVATAFSDLQSSLTSKWGLAQAITGNKDLGEFGQAMATFIREFSKVNDAVNELGDVNAEKLQVVADISKVFSDLQSSLEPMWGVVQAFAGHKDLGGFGQSMATFIREFTKVNDAVNELGDIDTTKMQVIVDISKVFSELQHGLEPMWGVVQGFSGHKDLGGFGQSMATFIREFSKVNQAVVELGDIDTTKMQVIVDISKVFSEFDGQLEAIGGVVGWWNGNSDIGTFGTSIASFIDQFKIFYETAKDIQVDQAVVQSVIDAATMLNEFNTSLGGIDWLKELGESIFGDSIDYLIDDASKMGMVVSNFSTSLAGADVSSALSGAEALREIAGLVQELKGYDASGVENIQKMLDGIGNLKVNANSLTAIGDASKKISAAIDELVKALNTPITDVSLSESISTVLDQSLSVMNGYQSQFSQAGHNTIEGFNTGLQQGVGLIGNKFDIVLSTIAGKLNGYAPKMQTIGTTFMNTFGAGMSHAGSSAAEKALSVCNKCILAMKGKATAFVEAGSSLMQSFANGITSGGTGASSAAASAASAAAWAANMKSDAFFTAGEMCGDGFARGLSASMDSAISTAAQKANDAVKHVRKVLDERSPSHVMEKVGQYFGEGFIIGIQNGTTGVASAASNMGTTAVETMTNTMTKLQAGAFSSVESLMVSGMNRTVDSINGMVLDEIDPNPSIRPVLDLTDVQNGVGQLDSMFSNQMIGVSGFDQASNASYLMNNRQNGTDLMLSALQDLKGNIGGTVNNYNSVNGVTYDDGSNITSAIETLVHATIVEGRM